MRLSLLLLLSAFVSGALAKTHTTPPAGALIVDQSGGKYYTTIQAAVNASTNGSVIFIQPGTYTEQVLVPKSVGTLTIYGYTTNDKDYTKNTVTITHNLGLDNSTSDDATGTLRVKNDNLKVYNINIVNTRGKGSQAIALSAYGTQQSYYGVQIKGYQDTVLSEQGNHFFFNSYIEGATDFIFGQRAIAWFESCTLGVSAKGYITASGRESATNPSWYVINNSIIEALPGVADGATYLGRPWFTYARVVFQNSNLSSVVNPAGWKRWDNTSDITHLDFTEYGNTGAGASTGARANFSSVRTSPVTLKGIFNSTSWIDWTYCKEKRLNH